LAEILAVSHAVNGLVSVLHSLAYAARNLCGLHMLADDIDVVAPQCELNEERITNGERTEVDRRPLVDRSLPCLATTADLGLLADRHAKLLNQLRHGGQH